MRDKIKEKASKKATCIGSEKLKAIIIITYSTRGDFRKDYTLRARIGIYIGVLLGLIELKFEEVK